MSCEGTKGINNPSRINLILRNKSLYFQNNAVIETGLSDVHRLTLIVMKSIFQKQVPKILNYRNYKHLNNILFQDDLMYEISIIGHKTYHLNNLKIFLCIL